LLRFQSHGRHVWRLLLIEVRLQLRVRLSRTQQTSDGSAVAIEAEQAMRSELLFWFWIVPGAVSLWLLWQYVIKGASAVAGSASIAQELPDFSEWIPKGLCWNCKIVSSVLWAVKAVGRAYSHVESWSAVRVCFSVGRHDSGQNKLKTPFCPRMVLLKLSHFQRLEV
jgi:hypothetical protein